MRCSLSLFKRAAEICCAVCTATAAVLFFLATKPHTLNPAHMTRGAKQNYCLLLNANYANALEENLRSRLPVENGQYHLSDEDSVEIGKALDQIKKQTGLCMDAPERAIPKLELDVLQIHATNKALGLE